MNKVIAIIQARLSSSRLPNKVLLEIIIDRISKSKYIEKIIVATSISQSDDRLCDYVKNNLSCELVRGSLNNVLERFYVASEKFPSEYIVRITADDPLKDFEIIDKCIEKIISDKSIDYCSNTIKPTYPEGLDVEVFKTEALKKAYTEAKLDSEKEHVTPYIWKNKSIFNTFNIEYTEDLSKWRWTVDKPQDLKLITKIYKDFDYDFSISYKKIIEYIKQNPNLLSIDNNTIRNEGYLKSVKEEQCKK
jgi:spore coat polysaccharide biosynthesis protein SpsF (cytidylyltransferase family)